ncbi:hypothetical protein NQ152_04935 [Microbacterium sp. zg.B48]|uniref:hypothetical protein n=1 Tax=unclassified Microbacterium TaxID=2609290 RepID=UPI00214AB532|nr:MULTISPECIES: hypothetical protein [unclassified Microbacterium]MCR2762848.1 hypothetical protein [Microbacterium sp. zg.B48]MCR2808435.1 hypothetical protein [Microbacterium sp. zg.B185]WIM19121.1 hypothetical protein QNO12_16310 [Microbacterium sp. zg-B185]
MPRLQADADPNRWVAVTGSLMFGGRRHRKAAIGMLLDQATRALGASGTPADGGSPRRRGGFAAWAMSQATPFLMRRAAGRVLVWVWKADPELLVVMAQVQEATAQLRAARASLPMEYDDTESFRGTYLGMGEKLVIPLPPDQRTPPFATYTWDTGTHFVTVTAVCGDRERFGTVIGAVDDLARTLRIVDDLAVGESPEVLRIEP